MGGLHGELAHAPFVFVVPEDWEGDEELTFLASREAVESLIERLRAAAREARNGAAREGWITETDGADFIFLDDVPSPFYAQTTGTDEMAPTPERMRTEEVAPGWMKTRLLRYCG